MTLSDFKTYVKYDFKRTDKDTELVRAYNDMLNWVSIMMPHSGFKYQSYISLSSGIEDYGIPNTAIHVIHPLKFMIGDNASDGGYLLTHVSKKEYDFLEPNPNIVSPRVGRPTHYTIYDRCILLTPIPDSSEYFIEMNWAKRRTTLSANSDLPELGEEWEEVLKQGTLERLYGGMGMMDEAAFWGNKYHVINEAGDDTPVGLCRKLFEVEKNREDVPISQVQFNAL